VGTDYRDEVTGFVTTAPALTRYEQGRGIDPSERELVSERPSNWSSEAPPASWIMWWSMSCATSSTRTTPRSSGSW
jgi:hypothetical protein